MSWADPIRVAVSLRADAVEGRSERRDALSQEWSPVLERWGATPFLVPNNWRDPARLLEAWEIDAVLLTGGNTPWAAEPTPPADAAPERDRTEYQMVEHALVHGLPVVGVCRGAQILNLYFGGRLQPLPHPDLHVNRSHRIRLHPWTGLASGEVNSFHRFGIAPGDLASELHPVAWDEAGWVEGFHHGSHPLLGVLWHPERQPAIPPVLDDLLRACLRRRLPDPASTPLTTGEER